MRGRAPVRRLMLLPTSLVLVGVLCGCALTPATSRMPGSSTPSATPSLPEPTPSDSRTAAPTPAATPTLVPTATPTATPTPAPTATPTPAPTAPPSVLVTHGSRTSGMVALTFDMGGRVEPAVAIVTWLRDHDVPATIFMTGAMAASTATDAGRTVLDMVVAGGAAFDLGNHTYSHPYLTQLTAAGIAKELQTTEAAIAASCSVSPRPLMRPPYGAWDAHVLAAAGSAGYTRTILWDIDTIDWKPIADGGPTAAQIVAKVLANAQGGSIVLMHLGGYETLSALPGIVDGLLDRGFQLVTLGQMLGV
jgi:peptidoglycan/xylan/chitin deacetylase (PgdA/CDA1 family)